MAPDFKYTTTVLDTSSISSAIPTTTGQLPPAPTLSPSIPWTAHLAMTIAFTVIFSLLFLFVYVQLWMILYYRHKRRSYQTVFLFLCLIWAALRIVLFSFYFAEDSMSACDELNPFFYWLLYSCPVVLQFTTLVLLVSFFSQVVIKARYPHEAARYKYAVKVICTMAVALFTTINVICGVLAQYYNQKHQHHHSFIAVAIRVSVNGFLFLLFGFSLSYWIYALNKIANARSLLESKGTNLWQSCLACAFIVFLFATRVVYNAVVLAVPELVPNMDQRWLSVTDQADFVDLYDGYNYVAYSAVLLLWEILPTFIVTVFFRVQKPSDAPLTFDDMSNRSYRQQHSVFDNPPSTTYRPDDDLSTRYSTSYNNGFTRSFSRSNGRQGASYDPRHVKSNVNSYEKDIDYNGT